MYQLNRGTLSIALVLLGFVALQDSSFGQAAKASSNNVSWGVRSINDVHLHRDIVTEKSKTLRVVSNDITFTQTPPKFPFKRTITSIVVTDQYTNGNGGYATLKAGGPNTDYATLHLKSQRGHGYSFIIDYYGQ